MGPRKGAQHAANILGALMAADRPLSAYALLDQLRPTGVAAPLTVYRALEKLIETGQVHRIETLNAFVACKSQAHHAHAHDHAHDHTVVFTICETCGAVDEFADPRLCHQIGESLRSKGFVPRGTALEVRGQCGTCRRSIGASQRHAAEG